MFKFEPIFYLNTQIHGLIFFLFFSRLLLLLLSLFFASELHFFLLQPNQCITTHLFRKKNTQTKLQSFCWFLTFISLSACDKKHTHTHIRILIENTLTKQKSILVYRSFFFHPSCCLWKFKWTKKLIKQEQKTNYEIPLHNSVLCLSVKVDLPISTSNLHGNAFLSLLQFTR